MDLILTILFSAVVVTVFYIPVGRKWCFKWGQIFSRSIPIGVVSGLLLWVLFPSKMPHDWLFLVVGSLILMIPGVPASILPFFLRDPKRETPQDDSLVISPADGEICYVKRVEDGVVPLSQKGGETFEVPELIDDKSFGSRSGFLVGIMMDFLDVHVNRAPIDGEITFLKHTPGIFISLRRPEAVLRNERQTMVFQSGGLRIAIVQIASRLVRRIEAFVEKGDQVARGQRVGVIKLGSQVDVFLLDSDMEEILVDVGQQVYAGETPIARLLPDSKNNPESVENQEAN